MAKFVNILGTKYKILVRKYDDDPYFAKRSIDGYCDSLNNVIVVCDMTTYKGWEDETKEYALKAQNEVMRHEIVHAFLNESGLKASTGSYDCGWARNEEMVDWIAVQGPKIYRAWLEAGCCELGACYNG